MLPSFLLSLLEITVTMSLLIGVLCLFNRIAGSKYTAKCRYILWSVVIIRLCIPVGMPFFPAVLTFSVPIAIEETATDIPTQVGQAEDTASILISPSETVPNEETNSVWIQENNGWQLGQTETAAGTTENATTIPSEEQGMDVSEEQTAVSMTASLTELFARLYSRTAVLFWLWFTVAAVLFGVRLGGYLLFTIRLRRSLQLPDAGMQDFCDRLGLKLGLGERQLPKLYVTKEVHSPMLCGYWRPIVLLPDISLTDNQLTGVLAHELTHRRRQDLWMKLACLLASSFHWFNPLVYLAANRCNREMELSCDELVLAGMDDEVRLAYGRVMLDIVKRCQPVSDLSTHYTPRKSAVTERFASILDSRRKKRWSVLALVALLFSVTAGSVFALASPEIGEMSEADAWESDKTETNTSRETASRAEGIQTVYVTLEPVETVEVTAHRYDVVFPDAIAPLQMAISDPTLPDGGRSPVPTTTNLTLAELIRTNQITPVSPTQDIFAVTGGVLSVQNTAYAYVFRKDPTVGWMVSRLYTGENGVACKGVVLHQRSADAAEDGIYYLLGLLCDDGSIRFYYSEDGYAWQSGTTMNPPSNSRFVQFANHSGRGSETLCIACDGGETNGCTVYLNFDNGKTFTRFDLPLLTAFPGDWTEARFVSRYSTVGSGEFSMDYQLLGQEGNRRLVVQGNSGSMDISLTLYPEPYEPDDTMLRQIRYTSDEDLGFESEDVPGFYEDAARQSPLAFPESFYQTAHTVSSWHVALTPSPHLTTGGLYTGRHIGGADGQNYVIFDHHPDTWHTLLQNGTIQLTLDYADVRTRRSGIPENGYFPTGMVPETDGRASGYGLFAFGDIVQEMCQEYSVTCNGEERKAVYERVLYDDGENTQLYHIYSIFASDRHLLRYVVAGALPLTEEEMRIHTGQIRILEYPPGEIYE